MISLAELQKNLSSFRPTPAVIAVSKLQSEEKIRKLFGQGQRIFAENYVQEALQKIKNLSDLKIEWHFIGTLQKNKINAILGQFHLIHSIDRLALAEALSCRAEAKNLRQKVLLQLNLSKEDSKGGWHLEDFKKDISDLKQLRGIEIQGLMTMPPLAEDLQMVRPYFRQLRSLRDELKLEIPTCLELSMGTSQDHLVAAEEGATMIRMGTALFGER